MSQTNISKNITAMVCTMIEQKKNDLGIKSKKISVFTWDVRPVTSMEKMFKDSHLGYVQENKS
jgi:hypothetical protein